MYGYLYSGMAAILIGALLFALTYFNQDKIKFKDFDQDAVINFMVFVAILLSGLGALAVVMSGLYIFVPL